MNITIVPGVRQTIPLQATGTPPIVWELTSGPTWASVSGSVLTIDPPASGLTVGQIQIITCTARNCRRADGTYGNTSVKTITATVEATDTCVPVSIIGVGTPPSTPPGPTPGTPPATPPSTPPTTPPPAGNCVLAISGAPASVGRGQTLSWSLSMASGSCVGGYQTWLVAVGGGGTTGSGYVAGQAFLSTANPYQIDTSNVAAGSYEIWAKCNGTGCTDTFAKVPVEITASGTNPVPGPNPSPTPGGSGACTVSIDLVSGSSVAPGGTIQVDVSASGAGCNSGQGWQVWLVGQNNETYLSGQGTSSGRGQPGQYQIPVGSVPNGTYRVRAVCNNGGACQGSKNFATVTVVTGGSNPTPGTPPTTPPPSSGCTANIALSNSGGTSIPVGNAFVAMLTTSSSECSSGQAWQIWLVGANDDNYAPGQITATGTGTPGQYNVPTTNMQPGTYRLRARCNNGGPCQGATAYTTVTVTASGSNPAPGTPPTTPPTTPPPTSGCAATITMYSANAPTTSTSVPQGNAFRFRISPTGTSCDNAWGAWLVGANNDTFAPGQITSSSTGVLNEYLIPTGSLPAGTYRIRIECAIAGACFGTIVYKTVTVT